MYNRANIPTPGYVEVVGKILMEMAAATNSSPIITHLINWRQTCTHDSSGNDDLIKRWKPMQNGDKYIVILGFALDNQGFASS